MCCLISMSSCDYWDSFAVDFKLYCIVLQRGHFSCPVFVEICFVSYGVVHSGDDSMDCWIRCIIFGFGSSILQISVESLVV